MGRYPFFIELSWHRDKLFKVSYLLESQAQAELNDDDDKDEDEDVDLKKDKDDNKEDN